MSKSLARVAKALTDLNLDARILNPGSSRTAEAAASACNCALDQIVKSLVFMGESGQVYLFLTAGGQTLDLPRASAVAGEDLQRADAATVRRVTGFAIGGVAPVGHLTPPRIFADPRLRAFDVVYAAAGTPDHVFAVEPGALLQACDATVADFTR